jgi:hypothetical protein
MTHYKEESRPKKNEQQYPDQHTYAFTSGSLRLAGCRKLVIGTDHGMLGWIRLQRYLLSKYGRAITSPRYLSVVLLTNEPHTLVAAAAQLSRLVEEILFSLTML